MIKVIDNAIRKVTFFELETGETFKFESGYFIKINVVERNDYQYNAVKLDDGELYDFQQGKVVIPFNCELIVI